MWWTGAPLKQLKSSEREVIEETLIMVLPVGREDSVYCLGFFWIVRADCSKDEESNEALIIMIYTMQ